MQAYIDACLHTFSFVSLNGAVGGVKDLGHDNVPEMCFPDSSLTLRMTERALGMTEA